MKLFSYDSGRLVGLNTRSFLIFLLYRNFHGMIVCFALTRSKEGRALIEECLFITEKHKGKDHESCVTHLVNLATSYSHSKNFAEAERLLRRSLQIAMKKVPPDDPSITYPMLHLAITLYSLNRDKEAESLALEVLRVREVAFGEESPLVGKLHISIWLFKQHISISHSFIY